jgi:hypothetical protein
MTAAPVAPVAFQAPDRDLRAAVKAAFRMLLHDVRGWVFEFVLSGWDDDAAGDVATLSSDFAVCSGDVTDCVVMATSPPRPGDRQPSPFACNVEALWVPSWSQGGVTVGFVVEEVEAIAGFANIPSLPQPGEPRVRAVGRLARDEATDELFCLVGLRGWQREMIGSRWRHCRILGTSRHVRGLLYFCIVTMSPWPVDRRFRKAFGPLWSTGTYACQRENARCVGVHPLLAYTASAKYLSSRRIPC